ncbi:MAG: LytTR family transcriptional regulator DNA-binding domain-containing protein [Clostridiales bacterium]|nr:LytTR family transcriptional regulator DNA-binding domain-containing protein [Clostridiales bacterium]
MESEKYIPIINKEEICKVYIEDILLIEQDLRKTMIYTEENKLWRYGKIDELLRFLDDRFFRCHQSCIINMDKVIKMKEQTIFFKNGFKIVMGKEKFKSAKQKFAHYMINGLLS